MARNHSFYSVFVFAVLTVSIAVPLYVRADTGTELTSAQISCIGTAVHSREASMNTALSAYFDSLKTTYTSRATALDAAYGKTTLDELKNAESLARLSFSSSVLDAFAAMKRVQLSAETTYANTHQACITGETNTNTNGNNENNSGNNNGTTNTNSGNTGNTNNGSGNTNGGGTATTTEPVASSTPTSTILFSDDFHRADGSEIGNGWETRCNGSGASVALQGGRLVFSGIIFGDCLYWRSDITQTNGISITSIFNGSTLGTDRWFIRGIGVRGNPSGSYADLVYGYGVRTDSDGTGVLQIIDKGNVLASGSYFFNDGDTTYVLEVQISAAPQNWMDVYIWNQSTGVKPSEPTIKFHNEGENYTPIASGNAFYIGYGSDAYANSRLSNTDYQVKSL